MRRSDEEDDEYASGYASTSSTTHWSSSYAVHPQGVVSQSSNLRGSTSGAVAGYQSSSSSHGMWLPHGSSYASGSYPRQDRDVYGSIQDHHQSSGHYPGTQWSAPPGNHGRQSMEPSTSRTSSSQLQWDPHHEGRPNTSGYQSSSNHVSYYEASSSAAHQPVSPTVEVHTYTALPSTPQSTIESFLAPVRLPDIDPLHKSKLAYRCTWAGCTKAARNELFKSKDNARVHVHKHFGSDKLFECVIPNCRKRFASEDAAKRHRDTAESKAFPCAVCGKVYARKDYRDVHQRRCTAL